MANPQEKASEEKNPTIKKTNPIAKNFTLFFVVFILFTPFVFWFSAMLDFFMLPAFKIRSFKGDDLDKTNTAPIGDPKKNARLILF